MGNGASNNARKTHTFANPNISKETTMIQVTPEVYERIQAQTLTSAAVSAKSKVGTGEVQDILKKTEKNNIHAKSMEIMEKIKKLEESSFTSTSSVGVEMLVNERIPTEALKKTEQIKSLEQAINSAKQSLRELNDGLPFEKGALGVGLDGRPMLETVGAWKVRQEKEEELRQNDIHWMNQLESMKGEYISSVLEDVESFFQRIEKVKQICPPVKPNSCASLCSKVAQCYSSNKNDLLSCRSVVEEFSNCVQRRIA